MNSDAPYANVTFFGEHRYNKASAYLCDTRFRVVQGSRMRAVVRELIETVILALLIFLALQFSVQNFRVEGSSMQPTLEEGQYILVNKLLYLRFDPQDILRFLPFIDSDRTNFLFPISSPERGEVIIFHFPRDPTGIHRVGLLPNPKVAPSLSYIRRRNRSETGWDYPARRTTRRSDQPETEPPTRRLARLDSERGPRPPLGRGRVDAMKPRAVIPDAVADARAGR